MLFIQVLCAVARQLGTEFWHRGPHDHVCGTGRGAVAGARNRGLSRTTTLRGPWLLTAPLSEQAASCYPARLPVKGASSFPLSGPGCPGLRPHWPRGAAAARWCRDVWGGCQRLIFSLHLPASFPAPASPSSRQDALTLATGVSRIAPQGSLTWCPSSSGSAMSPHGPRPVQAASPPQLLTLPTSCSLVSSLCGHKCSAKVPQSITG